MSSNRKSQRLSLRQQGTRLKGDLYKKYIDLVRLVTTDVRFLRAVSTSFPQNKENPEKQFEQVEKFANAVASINSSLNSELRLCLEFVNVEFTLRKHDSQLALGILGTDSIAMYYLEKYVCSHAEEYFAKILSTPFAELVNVAEDLSIAENEIKAFNLSQKFVEAIMSPDSLNIFPQTVKCVLAIFNAYAQRFKWDMDAFTIPFISQFLMRRFFSKALSQPVKYGITQNKPTGILRINMGKIEKHFAQLGQARLADKQNPFIEKYYDSWNQFCRQLLVGEYSHLITPPNFELLQNCYFDQEQLTHTHVALYNYAYDILYWLATEYITNPTTSDSMTGAMFHFVNILVQMGKPELNETDKLKYEISATGLMNVAEVETMLLEKCLQVIGNMSSKTDLSEHEDARYVYIGKPTKNNINTIYLTLHRMNKMFLYELDKFVLYLFKIIRPILNGYYSLVVDMTWAELDDEVQGLYYRIICTFLRLAKPQMLTYCYSIYLMHPTLGTRHYLEALVNQIPFEIRIRIVKWVFEWLDLSEIIDPPKIWIPFVSKKFVPVTYQLIRLTGTSSRKETYVKLTNESILDIDYKTCKVQNEILYRKLEEVRARNNSGVFEVYLKYQPESLEEINQRAGLYFFTEPKKLGVQTLQYTCFTESQLSILISEIYETGVRSASLGEMQSFLCDKQKKNGFYSKRMFKLTIDSVLHFKDKKIRSEVPYSCIHSVVLDPDNDRVLYIIFTKRERTKSWTLYHENAKPFRIALEDAIQRHRFLIDAEKRILFEKDFDRDMEKLYKHCLAKPDIDANWSSLIRIDTPLANLNKLWKALKPTNKQVSTKSVSNFVKASDKLKLGLDSDGIQHVIKKLDDQNKGYISLEDMTRGLYMQIRTKAIVERRNKQLALLEEENK